MPGPVGVSLERLGGVLVANNQVQGPGCRARYRVISLEVASDQTLHRYKCRHSTHFTALHMDRSHNNVDSLSI